MDLLLLITELLTIILMLYGDPSLPRNIVDRVITYFDNFISRHYLPSLKKDVLDILRKDANVSMKTYRQLDEIFQRYNHVFDKVNSEKKRFKLLERKGFREPEMYVIGSKIKPVVVDGQEKADFEPIYGLWLPLQDTLKIFLELPGIYLEIIDYMKKLEQEDRILSNIIQGILWKSMNIINGLLEATLPLYIFYDELETGNALGSHAGKNKFGATYASIAVLPPRIASRLDAILFCGLVQAKDKVKLQILKHLRS